MKRFALLVFVSMLLFTGCTDSQEVQMIKNGTIGSCPDVTVGQMVDSFMTSPRWESGESNEGNIFVNVGGDITYADKPVHALIQFVVYNKKGQFEFQVLEFNRVPQMTLLAAGVMEKMCQRAGESNDKRTELNRH